MDYSNIEEVKWKLDTLQEDYDKRVQQEIKRHLAEVHPKLRPGAVVRFYMEPDVRYYVNEISAFPRTDSIDKGYVISLNLHGWPLGPKGGKGPRQGRFCHPGSFVVEE